MRLDKYLKVSRLIKRRTVANEACDAGRVMVNGKPAKASANVKQGDTITIQFGNKEVKVEVLDVQETVKKEEAKEEKVGIWSEEVEKQENVIIETMKNEHDTSSFIGLVIIIISLIVAILFERLRKNNKKKI